MMPLILTDQCSQDISLSANPSKENKQNASTRGQFPYSHDCGTNLMSAVLSTNLCIFAMADFSVLNLMHKYAQGANMAHN